MVHRDNCAATDDVCPAHPPVTDCASRERARVPATRPFEHILTSPERIRIAAEAIQSTRTIDRVYRGERVAQTTYERTRRAAEKLGLPPPPPTTRAVREVA
jgi:hypothetical protein